MILPCHSLEMMSISTYQCGLLCDISNIDCPEQVGQALMVDDTAVYLAACQGRLSTFTDLADIIPIIPDDIRCHVITRLVSQCVELLTQSGTIDHKLGQHWADVTVSLINNHRSSIGR